MAAIFRAQSEEQKSKKAAEEDLLVKAAPGAILKLRSNSVEELGAVKWFSKLTVKELMALSYEYYKTNTPLMLKAKGVEALTSLNLKHPERLPVAPEP